MALANKDRRRSKKGTDDEIASSDKTSTRWMLLAISWSAQRLSKKGTDDEIASIDKATMRWMLSVISWSAQRLSKKGTDDEIASIDKANMRWMLSVISWSVPFLRYCGGILLAWCLACGSVSAQEATPSAAPLEFILRPVKEGFQCSLFREDRGTEVSFKKEPAYSGSKIYRHALRFGDGPADFIGVAFDAAANTLYIDRNRNLDLTDDGPGVKAAEEFYSEFRDVTLELTHEDVSVGYVLDIEIYGDYCNPKVRSGWKGDIELAGKPCSMGIADNLDGVFTPDDSFIFDHERHRAARLPFGEVDEEVLPQWFLFEGQLYRMAVAFRVQEGETVLAVTLTPITEGLMDISFEGQNVSRVVLWGRDDVYGILEWPVPAMRIPEGVYTPSQVYVLDSFLGQPEDGEELKPGGNTLLKVGGPLNAKVVATRSGATLNMNYILEGVEGASYEADGISENLARFAIYKDGRPIKTGQFEYG